MTAGGSDAVSAADDGARGLDTRPVILFDGVCNLCNAAVQWVIARDRNARYRFASLQSEAADELLRSAGVSGVAELPDSIALIDTDGVHVRSTAALKIGRGLGFPYSLSAVGWLVPRPFRDAFYRTVARHRYRWFGRRDTCMVPTPDLADRFLDAGEAPDPDALTPDRSVGPAQDRPSSWLTSWLLRLGIVYVLVYIAPMESLLQGVILSVGEAFFGVEASAQPTGSGDMTFNYLTLLVDIGVALVVSLVWAFLAGRRPVSARMHDVSRFVARYYLGFTMLTYGWAKVFPLQFPTPGPDRLIQSYGDSSPMGLAWTFLGASVGYQVFAGLCELVGGYLLFWRRTTLLGALVTAAVMTNVMAINYFHDVPVKLFSTHLFLIAAFLIAPDAPRLAGLFGFNLPVAAHTRRPFWRAPGRWIWAVMGVHVLFVGFLTVRMTRASLAQSRAFGVLAEVSPLEGVYRVESFERNGLVDREVEDAERWVRVGLNPPSFVTIQRATGDAQRVRLALSESDATMSFYPRDAERPSPPQFRYEASDAGVLRLEGQFEGARTVVVLRKDADGSLLTGRGFHWINEVPLNR